jgi:hypothetical protein
VSENQTTVRRGRTVAIFPNAAALGAALVEATGSVEIVNVIKAGRSGEVDPDAQPIGYMLLADGQPCTVCRHPVTPPALPDVQPAPEAQES